MAVASFLAADLTEIYRCDACSGQERLSRNGRGQFQKGALAERQSAQQRLQELEVQLALAQA
eukprot:COSAG01_NODE_40871_length_458_cov_2.253482_2_plen_61_part_01